MIVPRNKMVLVAALVLLPAGFLPAVTPGGGVTGIAIATVFVLLTVVDASMSRTALDGLHVELPAVVRLTKDRGGAMTLAIHNESGRRIRIRIGLTFPIYLESDKDIMTAEVPAETVRATLDWPLFSSRRGRYAIDGVYLETPSPLGFWAYRRRRDALSEVRVYPNLLGERRNLAALFLNRGAYGVHAQRQVGKGRDFEQLRHYIPGDSYDDLHWKATAKRGAPVTKIYQVERTQEIYVIMDASRLSAREVPANYPAGVSADMSAAPLLTTQLERFITCGLVLGMAAERQGDLFGVMAFSDRVDGFVRAKSGKAHYSACRDALYTLQPRIVNPDYDEACSFLRLRLRRRALLMFLTNLDDPVLAESFLRNVELLRKHHLVLVNMLQPRDVRPIFHGAPPVELDGVYERLAGHLRWHDLRELERVLHRRGVDFTLLENERLSVQMVSQYLSVKQRQAL